MKLSNEGRDLLVVGPEHVLHGRRQIQILYALRGPIGSDIAATLAGRRARNPEGAFAPGDLFFAGGRTSIS